MHMNYPELCSTKILTVLPTCDFFTVHMAKVYIYLLLAIDNQSQKSLSLYCRNAGARAYRVMLFRRFLVHD